MATAEAAAAAGSSLPRLRQLFDLERYGEFQDLLEDTIARPDELADTAEGNLCYLLHFAERACLEDRHIAALLTWLRPRCATMPALRKAWGAAAARRRWRQRLHASLVAPLELVSVGLHCLPWTLGNRWGFRSRAHFATTLNPFCLAIHKPDRVIAALRDDFAGYAEAGAIRLGKTPRGHTIAMRTDGSAVWNHNRGEAWLGDGYRGLIEGMARKAEAFRASARRPEAVFVVANAGVFFVDEPIPFLGPLREALTQATGRPDARLILTAQPRGGEAGDLWLDRNTALLVRPYPARDYIWSDDETADSEAGLAYERGYASGIFACLLRWNLARREATAA